MKKELMKKVQYLLCESAKELLTKLDEYFNVSVLETRFHEFTQEDQDEVVKWAGEIAYEPRINLLLVPNNEHEKRLFEMFTTVGRYIAEYEETKYYEQNYE